MSSCSSYSNLFLCANTIGTGPSASIAGSRKSARPRSAGADVEPEQREADAGRDHEQPLARLVPPGEQSSRRERQRHREDDPREPAMELADVGHVELGQRPVDVSALVVRGAERLEHAIVAGRSWGLVEGEFVLVIEGVQGEQLPLRAFIPVELDIVDEPSVGIPLGATKVGPGQELQEPAADPKGQQVRQE